MDELISFLEDVKLDFDWALFTCKYYDEYGELYQIQFPFCCQLSAQLIASFLAAHGYNAKCIFATPPNHYWCECNGLIIDYTDFQFDSIFISSEKERFQNDSLERNQFDLLIRKYPVLYSAKPYDDNSHSHRIMNFVQFKDIELLMLNEAKSYDFTKQGFLSFVSDYACSLQSRLNRIE